jgi:capsular exopolysaccharide synthesis family protein
LGHVFFDASEPGFNEVIRTIRTGISLDTLDKPHRVILVTSSIGEEGKSTLALNLAFAFAQLENVLLVDADMRRPSIGKELDLPRGMPGLSELIANKAKLPECIAHRTDENLDVLSTGFMPPNPLELLSSYNLRYVFRALRIQYDRIIVDSPPILPVSDAAVLSTHADSVVFVVKSDDTSVQQVQNGLDQLRRVNAPIAGVVVNQLDMQKAGKYSDYGYGGYAGSYALRPTET